MSRRRRKRRERSRRPSRRLRRVLVVVAVLGLVGLGAMLALDAVVVRGAVTDAERAALDARDRITRGDLLGARQQLRDARDDLGRASARTNRFLWRAAERVPLAGPSFRTLRGVVDVVDEGSGLGAAALDATEPLIAEDGSIVVQPVDGQLPVEILTAARGAADSLDPTNLHAAVDRLRTIEGPVPSFVADARDRVITTGAEVARTLDVVAPVLEVVPTFLGADGPQRYLLGMQNPAELRGTGGLLGFTAELRSDDGRLRITRPQSYSALDALGPRGLPPVETSEVFARRYADQNAAGFLGNVNVDPDLPTTGPVVLDLVESRTGRSFDGLLLVDPLAVAHVIREIAPVDVDPGIAALAPELPTTVTADEFADLVMVEHYAVFAGRNADRREWLSEVASSAFTSIFDARWDGVTVTKAIIEAAAAGHVSLYVRDADHQTAFVDADLAGALRPPATAAPGDTIAITANNSAGNKMDRHVIHGIEGGIALTGDPTSGELRREAELVVTVANPIPPNTFGLYVEGSFPVSQGERTPPSTERALARTWWSVWAPANHRVTLRTPDGPRLNSWVIHGQRVVDALVETPTETSESFTASINGSVPTEARGAGRVYRLHLRRQPKAIPDHLSIVVTPPPGWDIVSGESRGGDALVGVPGDGAEVRVVDGNAAIVGTVNTDLTVELLLRPE